MACAHDGYHAISTKYDPAKGLLVFVWTCERCGRRLGEAGRESYEPRFQPHVGAR